MVHDVKAVNQRLQEETKDNVLTTSIRAMSENSAGHIGDIFGERFDTLIMTASHFLMLIEMAIFSQAAAIPYRKHSAESSP